MLYSTSRSFSLFKSFFLSIDLLLSIYTDRYRQIDTYLKVAINYILYIVYSAQTSSIKIGTLC